MRGSNTTAHQNGLILDHLRTLGPITPQDALSLYGCFRLAARIYDLRNEGHNILTHRIMNAVGNPYAEYVLLRQAHD